MSATEVFFLALGLCLGVAVGAAFLDVMRARPPRPEVRLTITHNALPERPTAETGAASLLSSPVASLRETERAAAAGRERVAISVGRGLDPALAALRGATPGEPLRPPLAVMSVASGGAATALADRPSPVRAAKTAPPAGAQGPAGSADVPAPRATGTDPCAAQRRLVEERCGVAARARELAETVAAALREARRAYDDISVRIDAATRASDPRAIHEAKETARQGFRDARQKASSRADLERAAARWLTTINDINRASREASDTIAREGRSGADLLATMERLALEVDAARITAEAAAEGCRDARQALATCDEGGPAAIGAAQPTATRSGVERGEVAPAWAIERGGTPAVVRLLQGDREALAHVVATLAGEDPTERRRVQLLLSELVDAIVAGAITQAVLDFPPEHPFWAEFERSQGRDIVIGLASLGYRYDGHGGFVNARLPSQRDLSLALGYAGLDPMRMRHWPDEAHMAELFREVTVGADEYLATTAPALELADMLTLLGRRSEALADLWNMWGRARPVLLEPVPDSPSVQADHP